MVIFAGEVGAVVVAEGIETGAELAAVRAAGVSRGQGYGLARPQSLPLDDLEYEPVPFLDLIAKGGDVDEPTDDEAVAPDPVHAASRMRGVLASMANGVSILRRSDGHLGTEEFRALCASLARQVEHLDADLQDLIRITTISESSSID
jgi:hypothetical protein